MRLHENPIWKSTLQRITCPSSWVIENFLATTWHLTVWDAINHGSHQSTMNQSVVNEACTVHISVFIKTRKYIIGWTVWVCKTEFQPHLKLLNIKLWYKNMYCDYSAPTNLSAAWSVKAYYYTWWPWAWHATVVVWLASGSILPYNVSSLQYT